MIAIQNYPFTLRVLKERITADFTMSPSKYEDLIIHSSYLKLVWMIGQMEIMTDELKIARWLGYALRIAEDLGLLTNKESQDLVRQDVMGLIPKDENELPQTFQQLQEQLMGEMKRGAVLSPTGKTRTSIYFDDDVLKELGIRADAAGIGIQTLITEALRQQHLCPDTEDGDKEFRIFYTKVCAEMNRRLQRQSVKKMYSKGK